MNIKTKNSISIFLTIFLFLSSSVFAQEDNEKAAIAAAQEFLALVDSGQYEESWVEASSFFKSQVTQEQWVSQISRLRPLFGQVIDRTVKNTKYMTKAPGAPDGEYVLIVFQASFENKKEAIETITPMLDPDGKWRVSGYFIKGGHLGSGGAFGVGVDI